MSDYAYGESSPLASPWGEGIAVAAFGGATSENPHPVDSQSWREWLRGFEAWQNAPKSEIIVDDA